MNRLKEIILQLDRIRPHAEVHGVTVEGTTLATHVEAVTPRITHGHVGQDQRLVDCAGDVHTVFQPLVIERAVPRNWGRE